METLTYVRFVSAGGEALTCRRLLLKSAVLLGLCSELLLRKPQSETFFYFKIIINIDKHNFNGIGTIFNNLTEQNVYFVNDSIN